MSETVEQPVVETVAPPAPARKKRRLWPFGKEKAPPRPLLLRLFGLSFWGVIKLALLCVAAGFFVLAAEFDPRDPNVNVGAAMYETARSGVQAAGWAVRNFWKPALAGAGIVLPVWVLWRLLTLPFRR